jgi:hypothetical protein
VNNFKPERFRRGSGIRSVQIGEIAVTYLPDGLVQIKPLGLFPGTTAQDWAEYQGHVDGVREAGAPSTAVPDRELPSSVRRMGKMGWVREPLDDALGGKRLPGG